MLQWKSEPAMQLDPTKKYTATFHTEKGDIIVELFADKTPHTVNNFIFFIRISEFMPIPHFTPLI